MNIIFTWLEYGTTQKTIIDFYVKKMNAAYAEYLEQCNGAAMPKEEFELKWKAYNFDSLLSIYASEQERFLKAENEQHSFLEQISNSINCGNIARSTKLLRDVLDKFSSAVSRSIVPEFSIESK